jgi:hypothetical protein
MPENLGKTLWQDRRIRASLGLALVIRLFILGYLAVYPGGIMAKIDTKDYHEIAQNLLHYHCFARGKMPAAGTGPTAILQGIPPRTEETALILDPYRTPVYPAFLALIYGIGGGPYLAIIVQSILSLLLIWLTILLAARLFQPEIGWMVALLAAIEPLSLIYSHELMSDSLFTMLIVAAVYLFQPLLTNRAQTRSLKYAAFGGLLLGLAILTRPVGIYFPVLLLILWMVWRLSKGRQRAEEISVVTIKPQTGPLVGNSPGLKYLAVFVLVTTVTASTWAVRNYSIFHHVLISVCSDYTLLGTITSEIVAKVRTPEGRPSSSKVPVELQHELTAQMEREGLNAASEPERAAYFRRFSLGIIKAHPALFIRYYLKGVCLLFFPDIPSFYELLGFSREGRGGWGVMFQQGVKAALVTYFGPYWFLWLAAGLPLILYDLGVYVLALWGMVALWRNRGFYLLFMLLALIGYWVAVSGIVGFQRYRLPLMPFMIILAAWGWFNLRQAAPAGGGRHK